MDNYLDKKCVHCGHYHDGRCPLIKSIEYHSNGNIKKIEYWAPTDWAHKQSERKGEA